MASDGDLRQRIDQTLAGFVNSRVDMLASLDPGLVPLFDSARAYLAGGGKRLRPMFCCAGLLATGRQIDEAAITAAASLELVQACALAHDDLIDGSDSRRGRPALHREWAARHVEAGLAGDSDRYGAAAATLLGDLFLAWSDEMLSVSGLEPGAMQRLLPVWHRMRAELMGGQFLDVAEQAARRSSIEASLRIAELKSGRYSVQQPLLLGAAIGDASPQLVTALLQFGIDVGVAFQLRDDLLGVFGDPAVTGKPTGDDLREGKRTVLVAAALEAAPSNDAATLDAALGDQSLGSDRVAELQDLLRRTGAVQRVEAMIDERAERAEAILDDSSIAYAGRAALFELTSAALRRTS